MADVDEALVEEVAAVLSQANPKAWPVAPELARAVLAHLAATGRLLGEGEERAEWGVRVVEAGYKYDGEAIELAEDRARSRAQTFEDILVRRTVRTWTTPDGAAGTLVGPWVEVEG